MSEKNWDRRTWELFLGVSPGPDCPVCGNPETVPILYGMPGWHGVFEAAEAGAVAIGGCVVWEGMPHWQCGACGAGLAEDGSLVAEGGPFQDLASEEADDPD